MPAERSKRETAFLIAASSSTTNTVGLREAGISWFSAHCLLSSKVLDALTLSSSASDPFAADPSKTLGAVTLGADAPVTVRADPSRTSDGAGETASDLTMVRLK